MKYVLVLLTLLLPASVQAQVSTGGQFSGGSSVPPINAQIELNLGNDPSCPAPCPIVAAAWGTTRDGLDYLADPDVFLELDYHYDFGEGPLGNHPFGTPHDENEEFFALAGHVYETPGTYILRLTVFDPAKGHFGTTTQTITVTSTAAQWDGSTACYSPTGSGTCPDSSAVVTQSNPALALTDSETRCGGGPCRRILFEGGSTFSGTAQLQLADNGGLYYIGSYGTGRAIISDTSTDLTGPKIGTMPDGTRIINLDIRGNPAATGSTRELLSNPPTNGLVMDLVVRQFTSHSMGPGQATSGWIFKDNQWNEWVGTSITTCGQPCLVATINEELVDFAPWGQGHFRRFSETRGASVAHNMVRTTGSVADTFVTMRGPRCGCCGVGCTDPSASLSCRTSADCPATVACIQSTGSGQGCDDLTQTDYSYWGFAVHNDVTTGVGASPFSQGPSSSTFNELLRFYVTCGNAVHVLAGGPVNVIRHIAGDSLICNNIVRKDDGGVGILLDPDNGGQPVGRLDQIRNHRIFGNSFYHSGSDTGQSFIQCNNIPDSEARNNVAVKGAGSFTGDGVTNCPIESSTVCYQPGPAGCESATSPYSTAAPDPQTISQWVPDVTNGAALINNGDGFELAPLRRDINTTIRDQPQPTIGALEGP